MTVNVHELDQQNQYHRYLQYSMGGEEFAISMLAINEVLALPQLTRVPFCPEYFKGLTNIRGQIISVIDLRIRLGLQAAPKSRETSVIIVRSESNLLGLIVDSINQVIKVDDHEMSPVPSSCDLSNQEYFTGVCRRDNNLVFLVDIAKVCYREETQNEKKLVA